MTRSRFDALPGLVVERVDAFVLGREEELRTGPSLAKQAGSSIGRVSTTGTYSVATDASGLSLPVRPASPVGIRSGGMRHRQELHVMVPGLGLSVSADS